MQDQGLKILCVAFLSSWLAVSNAQEQSMNDQELPEYIAPCYRDDPKLSECIKNMMYGVIRKLVNGIPELDIPPIEPLFKEEVDAFEVAGLRLKFSNISVHGVSDIKIVWNSASTQTKLYAFRGIIDPLEAFADYELSGSFVFLPIRAAGVIHVVARSVEYQVETTIDVAPQDGVDYVKVSDLKMHAYITDGSGWVSNLGPFESAINRLLNSRLNARFIMDHLTPVVEESVAYILSKFSNRIFNVMPYDKVLPKGTGPVPAITETPSIYRDLFVKLRKRVTLEKIINCLY